MPASRPPILVALLALVLALASPAAAAAAPGAGAARPTGVDAATANQIDTYLASKGSPMAGQGAAFVASGGAWKVDPRLVVAIAGAESNFGQITCAPHNAWGWGCPNGPYRFTSWAEGIDTITRGLRTGYLAEGRTSVALIHAKYAPVGAGNDPTGLNNHWTINVTRFLLELGGDPSNVDLDGVSGSLPLGPEFAPAAAAPQFAGEVVAGGAAARGALALVAGQQRALVVEVRNDGAEAWDPGEVRLRRTDIEPRIGGAPYAAMQGALVEPGGTGRFRVELSARGSSSGTVPTRWRLEGPSGPFGREFERPVRVSVPELVAGEHRTRVDGPDASGVATVIATVRNAGSASWLRDGEQPVVLAVEELRGAGIAGIGWPSDSIASPLLEREVAPGELGTFAFRVRVSTDAEATLRLRPSAGGAPGGGAPVLVRLRG